MLITIWLFLFSASVFLSFSMADPDYWGHIKFGQTIYEAKSIPETDDFSYTANGLKWLNHEWLSEIIFWCFYKNFSDYGIIFVRLFVGLVFCFCLWWIVKTDNFEGSIIAYLLIFFTVIPFWHFRPQIFTFLFFAVLIYLIRTKIFLLIPILFLFWANLHGGFVAGLVYLLIFTVFSVDRKKILLISLISIALSFINPYNWELWSAIFRAFFNPLTRSYITDWQPSHFFDIDFTGYWGFVLVFSYFTVTKLKKISFSEIVLPILFLVLSLTSIRHIPIFAIVSLPVIRFYFLDLPTKIYSKAIFVIIVFLTVISVYFKPKIEIEVDNNAYPVEAVQYLKKINFSGNIFCEFDWGEYILFHFYPYALVSIDGRYDTIYPVDFIKNHFRLLNTAEGNLPENTDAVLIYSHRAGFEKFGWQRIYSDKTTTLYKVR
ncbi:MAG: hypothetical protein AB1349_01080 [Elusimicrobiota bacterium]